MKKANFSLPVTVETRYVSQLNKIAANVQMILDSYPNDPAGAAQQLTAYSQVIEAWARLVAYDMLKSVERNRVKVWAESQPKREAKNVQMIRARKEKRHGIVPIERNLY